MKANETYIKTFSNEDAAHDHMRMKNRVVVDGTLFCLVDGPDDQYSVVDLKTAIELGGPYTWATR